MGNCCGGEAEEEQKQVAFSGQGHRLGSADDAKAPTASAMQRRDEENMPEPIHNLDLTDEERERQRANRLMAAEARIKSQQTKKPTKKSSEPLKGPNSKPTMTWTVGS